MREGRRKGVRRMREGRCDNVEGGFEMLVR